MAVSVAPRIQMAWVCPECGHGSPEPRDRPAHLDAHRQLRQFLNDWEAAGAAADRASEDGRRRQPLLYIAVALVLMALAASSLRGIGQHDTALRAPLGPTPGVAPAGPEGPPAPPSAPVPSPDRSRPTAPTAANAASPPSVPVSPARGEATAVREPPPAPASPSSSAATESPATASPATADPNRPVVTVQGCVLVICVNVGR